MQTSTISTTKTRRINYLPSSMVDVSRFVAFGRIKISGFLILLKIVTLWVYYTITWAQIISRDFGFSVKIPVTLHVAKDN